MVRCGVAQSAVSLTYKNTDLGHENGASSSKAANLDDALFRLTPAVDHDDLIYLDNPPLPDIAHGPTSLAAAWSESTSMPGIATTDTSGSSAVITPAPAAAAAANAPAADQGSALPRFGNSTTLPTLLSASSDEHADLTAAQPPSLVPMMPMSEQVDYLAHAKLATCATAVTHTAVGVVSDSSRSPVTFATPGTAIIALASTTSRSSSSSDLTKTKDLNGATAAQEAAPAPRKVCTLTIPASSLTWPVLLAGAASPVSLSHVHKYHTRRLTSFTHV